MINRCSSFFRTRTPNQPNLKQVYVDGDRPAERAEQTPGSFDETIKKSADPISYSQLNAACQAISAYISEYFIEQEKLKYEASLDTKALKKYNANRRSFFRTSSTPIKNIYGAAETLGLERDVWEKIANELDKLAQQINLDNYIWQEIDLDKDANLATLIRDFALTLHHTLVGDECIGMEGFCSFLEGEKSPLGIGNPKYMHVIVSAIKMSTREDDFVEALTKSSSAQLQG